MAGGGVFVGVLPQAGVFSPKYPCWRRVQAGGRRAPRPSMRKSGLLLALRRGTARAKFTARQLMNDRPDHNSNPQRRAKPTGTPLLGRILLVERDELVRWSIGKFMQRWFAIESIESPNWVEQLAKPPRICGLILSDEVSAIEAAAIQELVRRRLPDVRTVRMTTGTQEADGLADGTVYLEKPFELSELARVLGVPDDELHAAADDQSA